MHERGYKLLLHEQSRQEISCKDRGVPVKKH